MMKIYKKISRGSKEERYCNLNIMSRQIGYFGSFNVNFLYYNILLYFLRISSSAQKQAAFHDMKEK